MKWRFFTFFLKYFDSKTVNIINKITKLRNNTISNNSKMRYSCLLWPSNGFLKIVSRKLYQIDHLTLQKKNDNLPTLTHPKKNKNTTIFHRSYKNYWKLILNSRVQIFVLNLTRINHRPRRITRWFINYRHKKYACNAK